MNKISLLLILVSVSGCGIAHMNEARDEMEKSKLAYKECLLANSSNVSACEGYRLSYEADAKQYNGMANRLSSVGNNYNYNLSTQAQ